MNEDIIDLGRYFDGLWRMRYALLIAVIGITVGAVGVAALSPARYASSAIVVIPASVALPSDNPFSAPTASPISVLAGIAHSAAMTRAVAQDNGLSYEAADAALEFQEDPLYNQMTLRAVTTQRAKSHAMVDSALQNLRMLSDKVGIEMAQAQARELAGAVEKRSADLRLAEAQFVAIQRGLRTPIDRSDAFALGRHVAELQSVEMDLGEVEQRIQFLTDRAHASLANELPSGDQDRDKWRNQLVQLRYDLEVLRTKWGDRAPSVTAKQRELDVAERTHKQEIARYLTSIDKGYDAKRAELEADRSILTWRKQFLQEILAQAPKDALAFVRAQDQLSARQGALAVARSRYEVARLAAVTAGGTWSVLLETTDSPTPVNRRYALIAAIAAAVGLVIVVTVACFRIGRARGSESAG